MPGAPAAAAAPPTGLADLVSNDAGETDLVDSQYAIFNLVALCYVIGVFVTAAVNAGDLATVRLPTIPSALLGLTGVAALTYVGNKAVQQTGAPRIQSVDQSTAAAGTPVTVRVVNLDAAATVANTQVLLTPQGGGATVSIAPTLFAGGQVQFTAPLPTGVFDLSVVAPSGMVTDATPLTVT